jgi:hypothetical protein
MGSDSSSWISSQSEKNGLRQLVVDLFLLSLRRNSSQSAVRNLLRSGRPRYCATPGPVLGPDRMTSESGYLKEWLSLAQSPVDWNHLGALFFKSNNKEIQLSFGLGMLAGSPIRSQLVAIVWYPIGYQLSFFMQQIWPLKRISIWLTSNASGYRSLRVPNLATEAHIYLWTD